MSTKILRNLPIAVLLALNGFAGIIWAQDTKATINIYPEKKSAHIEIENGDKILGAGLSEANFLDSYAGYSGLRKRIVDLKCWNEAGTEQYCAATTNAPKKIEYSVDLEPKRDLMASAHISWQYEGKALLLLNDLLPLDLRKAFQIGVKINAPESWEISSVEKKEGEEFLVKDFADSAFWVAQTDTTRKIELADENALLEIEGDWGFSDAIAKLYAEELLDNYSKEYGKRRSDRVVIRILEFPGKVVRNRWRAETRGQNITVISSGATFPVQDEQRLNEQLRHELFHLWAPGNLQLSGNYAWFYEGFGSYIALKKGLELRRIRLRDYLNVLGQAYALEQRRTLITPVLELTGGSAVYVRGILAAFAIDVGITKASKGEENINSVVKTLVSKYAEGDSIYDANPALLETLNEFEGANSTVDRYIKNASRFELSDSLKSIGLEFVNGDFILANKPNRKQKALRKKLGYTN